jgi:hypothetical protein
MRLTFAAYKRRAQQARKEALGLGGMTRLRREMREAGYPFIRARPPQVVYMSGDTEDSMGNMGCNEDGPCSAAHFESLIDNRPDGCDQICITGGYDAGKTFDMDDYEPLEYTMWDVVVWQA